MSDERTFTRRTVGRLTAGVTTVGSLVLGRIFEAYTLEDESSSDRAITTAEVIDLPNPTTDGDVSVEAAIAARRSRREYTDEPLSKADLGQLLWAAQGITKDTPRFDFKTAPSAGAQYPLEVYVVVGNPGVEAVSDGIYQYEPRPHQLVQRREGDYQLDLQRIGLDQEWIGDAAIDIVITAVDAQITDRYGQRGRARYVPMEAGHVGENIYLQAEARNLATAAVGAFRDADLLSLLDVPDAHRPLYIFPVGKRQPDP